MEVHHSHNAPHTKKWTAYLLEFLMLFLAVFLGFVAENIREHVVEKRRAKEYAISLLTDMKKDVTELDQSIGHDSLTALMVDSLVHFIAKVNIQSNSGQFYYLYRMASALYITDWNKATINQLINSGSLRYFTNAELVNKLNTYNTLASTLSSIQQTISNSRDRTFTYSDQIFIPEYLLLYTQFSAEDILAQKKSAIIDSLKNLYPPLQSNDPALINSLGNSLLASRANRSRLLTTLYPTAREMARYIIALIKKEYHLKD
jgi:predicted transcriptional regulator